LAGLEVVGVTKVFGAERSGVTALAPIDLKVKQNEFVCILGPSGCGKSTLLNIVAGFVTPSAGHVLLEGEPVLGPGADRGVVFQEHALFPWLTVAANIEFGLRMRGVDHRERASVVERYVKLMGLAGFESRYPKDLSGGMKQRVAIARAMANEPQILLMDEPFGALDAQTRALMQAELTRVWLETRKTVLFVTHSIEESILLADRVVAMSARPGTIKEIVSVPMPRPRDDTSPEFNSLKRALTDLLRTEIKKATEMFAVVEGVA